MLTEIAKAAALCVCVVNCLGVLVVVGVMVYDQIKYGKDPLNE